MTGDPRDNGLVSVSARQLSAQGSRSLSSMTRALFRVAALFILTMSASGAEIPRPEHPTPDAVRKHWANLNGKWEFRFDPKDEGLKAGWEKPGAEGYDQTIVVPYPWESELSGI